MAKLDTEVAKCNAHPRKHLGYATAISCIYIYILCILSYYYVVSCECMLHASKYANTKVCLKIRIYNIYEPSSINQSNNQIQIGTT